MNDRLCYVICLIIIGLGIFTSVKRSLKSRDVTFSLERFLYYLSILTCILMIALKLDTILDTITRMATINLNLTGVFNDLCKIALLIFLFFFVQIIVYQVLKCILVPVFRKVNKYNSVLLVLLSSVFGSLKGIAFLGIIFIGVITYNNTIGTYNKIQAFNSSKLYSSLSQVLNKNTSELTEEIVENFLPASKVIIYYNGVILEDGVMTTEAIDRKARELTSGLTDELDKARVIYSWIGSNVVYDYDRAEKALNNEKVENSGAIYAFESGSGICFDFSCLYVAMARANDMKVRLLIGSAFDGKQYGPHAWNEVYVESIDKWVPVDTTFYSAGDYFNNDDFYADHILESIAGEW